MMLFQCSKLAELSTYNPFFISLLRFEIIIDEITYILGSLMMLQKDQKSKTTVRCGFAVKQWLYAVPKLIHELAAG